MASPSAGSASVSPTAPAALPCAFRSVVHCIDRPAYFHIPVVQIFSTLPLDAPVDGLADCAPLVQRWSTSTCLPHMWRRGAQHAFLTSSKRQFFHPFADRCLWKIFAKLGLDCMGPPPSASPSRRCSPPICFVLEDPRRARAQDCQPSSPLPVVKILTRTLQRSVGQKRPPRCGPCCPV